MKLRPLWQWKLIGWWAPIGRWLGGCERCGYLWGVTYEPCRTQYADEKMNVEPKLCRSCAQEHHDYWDERWAEYYGGLL